MSNEFELICSKVDSKNKELFFESIIEEIYDSFEFNKKYCHFCGESFNVFLPFKGHKQVLCPNCGEVFIDTNIDNKLDPTKFDEDFYKNNYIDDLESNEIDYVKHYMDIGAEKGFDPNNNFSTNDYLELHPDVKKAGMNPFIHYLKYGKYEGRLTKIFTLKELLNQDLKLSLRGKKDYYFLINDSNNELRQHFDENYINKFDDVKFLENYYYKKDLFKKNNIIYDYFIVPDKSVVCRKFLPFNFNILKRNIDKIKEIKDFAPFLNESSYFKYDSHINYDGGKIFAFHILNSLNICSDFNSYLVFINKSNKTLFIKESRDLLADKNWSYSLDEKNFKKFKNISKLVPSNLKLLMEEIPNEFKFVHNRRTSYYINENSFTDLKVLIFGDSTREYYKDYLLFYFKETLFYWDHGNLNKELIKWFNPDLILEIRVERFLEGIPHPSWVENKEEL